MSGRGARAEGGLVGALVGDALGVPYELHPPDDIPEHVEMESPEWFRRSHPQVPPGTYSDDGAHQLALMASLLRCERLDLDDLGRQLVQWYDGGELASTGTCSTSMCRPPGRSRRSPRVRGWVERVEP